MNGSISPQAYDRAITVFSPDGRLFQVEYAKEAVKRGATAMGIIAKDGLVFVAKKVLPSELAIPSSIKKIYKVHDNVLLTASGLIADARVLVEVARREARRQTFLYDELPLVQGVATYLSNLMQAYTQYGGARPFGVSLLVGGKLPDDYSPLEGFESKYLLYEIEPSGALTAYKAAVIGEGKKEAEEYLVENYSEKITVKDAVKLGLEVLKSLDKSIKPEFVECAYISDKTKGAVFLSPAEIKKNMR